MELTSEQTFTVTLSKPCRDPVSILWAAKDGSAKADADYSHAGDWLTFDPGETTQSVTVSTLVAPAYGGDVSISAHLSDVDGASIDQGTGVGTITRQLTVGIDPAGAYCHAVEGSDILVPVRLSRPCTDPVTVNYTTAPDPASNPAQAGTDYTPDSGSLTIPAGTAEGWIRIHTLQDDANTEGLSFVISLTSASAGTVTDDTATALINPAPAADSTGSFTITPQPAEPGDGSVTFTIQVRGTYTAPTILYYTTADDTAVAGVDYQPVSGQIDLAQVNGSTTISVPVLGGNTNRDCDVKLIGTFDPTPEWQDTPAVEETAAIYRNLPYVGFYGGYQGHIQAVTGDGAIVVGICLSRPCNAAVTVEYATTPSNPPGVQSTSGVLTIPAEDIAGWITIPLHGYAGDFGVELSGATNAQLTNDPTLGVEVAEDDRPAFSVIGTTVAAGQEAVFKFTLTTPSDQDATIQYGVGTTYATAGVDYDASNLTGTLTIPAGQTEADIHVPTYADPDNHSDRALDIYVDDVSANIRNVGQGGNVRIVAPLMATVSTCDVAEGDTATFMVALSKRIYHDTVTVQLSGLSGTAHAGTDFLATLPPLVFQPGDGVKYVKIPTYLDPNEPYAATSPDGATPAAAAANANQATFQLQATVTAITPPAGDSDPVDNAQTPGPASTGTGTIDVASGSLTFTDDNGTPIPNDQKMSSGTVIWCNPTGETPFTVKLNLPQSSDEYAWLDYDDSHVLVYTTADGNLANLVQVGARVSAGTYYVKGWTPSATMRDSSIGLLFERNDGSTSQSVELDRVKVTVVSACITTLTVDNEYQKVAHATTLADKGQLLTPDGAPDWIAITSSVPLQFCVKEGSYLWLTASLTIMPSDVLYKVHSDTGGKGLGFSISPWESGSETQYPIVSENALPDSITEYTESVGWKVDVSVGGRTFQSRPIATTTFDAFTTFAQPIANPDGGDNSVTDTRLRKVIAAVSAPHFAPPPNATDDQRMHAAAEAIQHWIPANINFAPPTNLKNKPYLHNWDAYWAMLDLSEPGQCDQCAMLHELMLAQVGIQATMERILPTLSALTAQGKVRTTFGIDDQGSPEIRSTNSRLRLWLIFPGRNGKDYPNDWEGGVMVDGFFYPEGSSTQSDCLIVGMPTVNSNGVRETAEYDALKKIAYGLYGTGSQADNIQRWVLMKENDPNEVEAETLYLESLNAP